MDVAALSIGVLLGAATTAALYSIACISRGRKIDRLIADLELARGEATDLRVEAERQLAQTTGDLHRDVARLEAQLQAERRLAQEKLNVLFDARDELIAVVKESAGEALTARGADLLKTLKAELGSVQVRGDMALERRQKAVEELVSPVRQTLEQLAQTIRGVDEDRRRSNIELAAQLRQTVQSQKDLQAETQKLSQALKHPTTRGRWGELHLRRLIEIAGMSALCDFTEQKSIDRDGDTLRPDLIVHLPGERHVVIDAKAPLAHKNSAGELSARHLRAHVRRLSQKNYSAQVEGAVDFVVLYLPGEHLFSAALSSDPDLIENAADQSVLIASPTTLLVLLKTIAQAWHGHKAAEESEAIAKLAKSLHEQMSGYLDNVNAVGKRLNAVIAAHNAALDNLGRLLPLGGRITELALGASIPAQTPRLIDQRARGAEAVEQSTPPL